MSKTRKVRYPLKFVRVWDDNGQHALLDGLLDAVTGCSAWENSAGECLSFGARIPPSSFRLRCLGEGSSGAEELMGEAKIMQLLELSKTWVGDGMLYTMTTPDSFYYQPWKGEWYRE